MDSRRRLLIVAALLSLTLIASGVMNIVLAQRVSTCSTAAEVAELVHDSYDDMTRSMSAYFDDDYSVATDALGDAEDAYEKAVETADDAGYDDYTDLLDDCQGDN